MTATRIVLADDHALVRAGIRNALEDRADLEIVGEVGDGPGLAEALDRLRPDLLLIDVTMPQFEPIATIRQIRQRYPEMHILVVSAHDDDVYVQGLLRAGVDGYHLKDQPLGDLRLAVARVLAGERWISSPLVAKLLKPEGGTGASAHLSPRQRDILQLLAEGLDNRTIAAQLGISIKTVETHLTRLYRQINVQSRLEAASYAHQHPDLTSGRAGALPENQPVVLQEQQTSILVVDDNQRYRQQLRRMVGRIIPQATLYEAENTKDALHLARRLSPQIVFVDVVLGEESGIRCTQQIKMVSRQSRVILISAYPDREFHRMGLEAGASAFLDKKDLDAATLHQIISDTMGQARL